MKMYFKNNRTALIFLLAMLVVAPIKAQVAFGDAAKFNDGWLFRLTDDSAIVRTDYDDSEWRKLSLPHDWSIEGQLSPTLASCTGYLPGGIGWYRKHFRVEDNATRHYIYFEGVYNRSEVYLNGHLLGRRPNGYVSFLYDMTPYLKEGDNVLAVRVDHSRYADSRWYTGSGIYRDVWLVAAPDTHIAQWGVGWHAASLTDKQAVVAVDVEASIVSARVEVHELRPAVDDRGRPDRFLVRVENFDDSRAGRAGNGQIEVGVLFERLDRELLVIVVGKEPVDVGKGDGVHRHAVGLARSPFVGELVVAQGQGVLLEVEQRVGYRNP